MKQKKICPHENMGKTRGKIFYCNQECGFDKSKREDFCFCAKHYIECFFDGDVEEFLKSFKTKNDFCITRLAQIDKRCVMREKVKVIYT